MNEIEKFWQNYLTSINETKDSTEKSYISWHFMTDDPEDAAFANELTELVKSGVKTATATLAYVYDVEGVPYPAEGSYHIVTTFEGSPTNVIRMTKVRQVPYTDVTEEHAYKEGEGDRSLQTWQTIHLKFFDQLLAPFEMKFTPDMKVLCIEFEVVY